MTSSAKSSAPTSAAEIRRIVAAAKAKGLLAGPGEALKTSANQPAGELKAHHLGACSQWVDIAPDDAARMLDANQLNRSISRDVVAAYAREMAAGAWQATHQGIAFDDSGKLIDGQHRLQAVIESGATIRMMVTYGLPARPAGQEQTAMDVVDRGRPRSTGNQLKLQHGIKYGAVVASICYGLASLCASRARRPSIRQTLAVYQEFKGAIEYVVEGRSKQRGLRVAGVQIAFAFAMTAAGLDNKAIRQIYAELIDTNIEPTWPAIAQLRAFLLSDTAALLTKGHSRGIAELTLQAIDLACKHCDEPKNCPELKLETAGADWFRSLQPERVARVAALFAAEADPS